MLVQYRTCINEVTMLKKIVASITAIIFTTTVFAAEITGAGATFPFPVYSKWADSYKEKTGNTLNYQSIGSGAGVKQIQASTVSFGATDSPLKPEQLAKDNLLQFPTVIGGIVIVFNLNGVDKLTIDGKTLADIYIGKITKWNDPAIAKLNPNAKLPDINIVVVRRSDGSGTTAIFTNYLSNESETWSKEVGSGTAIEWVGNTIGAKGNDGVSSNVQQTAGAIGYVEYAYAKQNKLTYMNMINNAGKLVDASVESFKAAADGASFDPAKGFYALLTSTKSEKAWPISGATFILVRKDALEKSKTAIDFFNWAYDNGDKMAEELYYVPLPKQLKDTIREYWKANLK